MQAITTRFIGPTNSRGARYKATCEAGSITLGCDYALDSEGNHIRAAQSLIARLGWFHDGARGDRYGDWFHGGTPGGYVFVCAVEYAKVPDETNYTEQQQSQWRQLQSWGVPSSK
jgi:hypothetical protein